MNLRPALKLALAVSFALSGELASAQAPAVAHKATAPATGSAPKAPATKPAVAKKLSFAEDTFSAERKLLDARAQNLSPQDFEAQKKAATQGAPDSMYLVGARSFRLGDEVAAKQWWEQAAQKDYVFAMLALAELPSTEAREKRQWLESAAGKGVPQAEFHLGEMLLLGQDGPQAQGDGKKIILKAAADGCVEAENLVGASYLGLSSKYPGLFENNPAMGQQYLRAAKSAHSLEARNTLRLAVEKGILPDPLKGAPQLDSGRAFVAYLQKLDTDDRVFYLRQQIAKYPQSVQRTKALEEVVWLASNPTNEPEFKTLETQDPANLTVEMLRLSAELDRMLGQPQAEATDSEVKAVSDVVARWKAATGFGHLAQHSYMLTHEVMTIAGEENPHQINCATDLKNLRLEEPDDFFQITAAKDGRFQYYRPRENGEDLKPGQAADRYNNPTTYLMYCLNLPLSVQAPDQFKFVGVKTFMGAPAYALAHNSSDMEDYFDIKSFFYLGSQQSKGAWTRSVFGYRDFGGAVLPQYLLFQYGNNIRLRKFTGLQWDLAPVLDGDIFTLAFTPYPQYPQSKWIKPVLADTITQNEITQQAARVQQELEKLKASGDAQFGLDPGAQKDRNALLARMQVQWAGLGQNSQEWDQVATAIFAAVVQHDRERRYRNPVNARDVYLNWQDVTNLKSILAHKTLRVQLKHSTSGSNSEMSYCAVNDAGSLRSESVGSLVLQNDKRQVSYSFDKKRGFSAPSSSDSNPAGLRQNFLSSCLLGLDQASTTLSTVLQTSALGTGTIYKRPAYVIFEKYSPTDSTDDAIRFFFDKETYVLLGIQQDKNESPLSYSDFRKVGDSIVPFREYHYEGGQYPSDTIDTIEKFDLDAAMDAKEFDLNPRAPQILYAANLKEKRPDLYKSPSPWAALATGALLGVAQGAANNPSLFASAQQAQLVSLQATIAAQQVGGDLVKLAAPSYGGLTPNSAASLGAGKFSPSGIAAPSTPLMSMGQLQMLEGLVLSSSSDGTGSDTFSSSLLRVLKQMGGEGNLIQQTADEQSAAILAIGNANAAKKVQAAQARQTAQQRAPEAAQQASPSDSGPGSGSSGAPPAGSAQQAPTQNVPPSPASFTVTGSQPGNPVQTGFNDTQTGAPLVQYTGWLNFNIPSGFHFVGGEVSVGGTSSNGDPTEMAQAFNQAVSQINQGHTCTLVGSFGGTFANIQNNQLKYETVPGQTIIAACITIAPNGLDNAPLTYQGAAELKMPAGVSISLTKAPSVNQ